LTQFASEIRSEHLPVYIDIPSKKLYTAIHYVIKYVNFGTFCLVHGWVKVQNFPQNTVTFRLSVLLYHAVSMR